MLARVQLGPEVFPVHLRTRTELDVLREIGLDDEYRLSDPVPAETIVDLGAHIGLATLRMLAVRPGARVLAVEADPKLIPRLRQNVKGLPVTVIHAAICAHTGEQEFFRSDISSWGNSLDRTSPHQIPVQVPALSIEDLLDSQGIEQVDLLKLDIEGAEWGMFEDGVPAQISAIVGEIHARGINTPEKFLDKVSKEMHVRTISSGTRHATFLASRNGRD